MSFRALLSPLSLSSTPPSSPPYFPRRPFSSDATRAVAGAGVGVFPSHRPHLRLFLRFPARGSGERRVGKLWADVKSERFEVSDSVSSEPVKFADDVVGNVVVDEDEELDNVGPWWENFPKRWVIVLLCFSAFLLCNMDRVSELLFNFIACLML